jgi:hypothetical protein
LGARGWPYQFPCAVRKDGSAVFGTAVKKVSGRVGGIPVVVHYAGAAPGRVVGLMYVSMEIPNDVQPGGHVPVALQIWHRILPTVTSYNFGNFLRRLEISRPERRHCGFHAEI